MEDFFSYAESNGLKMTVTSFNDLATFSGYLEHSPEFKRAVNAYLANPATSFQALMARINTILDIESDTNYLHPYDAAIASYLLLAFRADKSKSKDLATAVTLRALPNFWWTRHMLGILARTTTPSTTFRHMGGLSSGQIVARISPSSSNSVSSNQITNRIRLTNA